MLLIGFSGKMRSGKDTAADYIEHRLQTYGWQLQRLAFADTLKRIREMMQIECGFEVAKDREAEQWIGTDYGRKRDPEVWVKALERKIVSSRDAGDVDAILITDVRFPNELDMLERHGATIIRTHASESTRIVRGADVDKMYHLSETALDLYDQRRAWECLIENEGSLADFHKQIELVLAKVRLEAGSF